MKSQDTDEIETVPGYIRPRKGDAGGDSWNNFSKLLEKVFPEESDTRR